MAKTSAMKLLEGEMKLPETMTCSETGKECQNAKVLAEALRWLQRRMARSVVLGAAIGSGLVQVLGKLGLF